MARHDARRHDPLRPVRFTRRFTRHAQGSVLVEFGETRVLCTAMAEDVVPPHVKSANMTRKPEDKAGWVSAEYAMLPSSTNTRKQRDRNGKTDGRSVEIQRLIGRSLRAIIDLEHLGERTIWIDCDVLQADGGTRTAAITGSYVALFDCLVALKEQGKLLKYWPLIDSVAAVSVGMVNLAGLPTPVLDLDYVEDSAALADMNVVMTGKGQFIEVQGTAEKLSFPREGLDGLLNLATVGCAELGRLQKAALDNPA